MTHQTFAEVFKPWGNHRGVFIFLVDSPTIARTGYWSPDAGVYIITSKLDADRRLAPVDVQRWEYINKRL